MLIPLSSQDARMVSLVASGGDMAVVCPLCGKLSRDAEFCDFCNADLARPKETLAPARCPLGEEGIELTPEDRAWLAQGNQALFVQAQGKHHRVHWLTPGVYSQRRTRLERRRTLDLAPLAPIRWIEEARGAWIIAESSGPWQPPWLTREEDPLEELKRLASFVRQLASALDHLHSARLIWLNFDPAHLEPALNSSSWCFTNLDDQVFYKGQIPEDFRYHPAFAAPEIALGQAERVGKRTDVFHLAVFSYYWLAGLLPTGVAGQGLPAFHFEMPPLRIYAPGIPPGVQSVLTRGMAIDRRERFATTRAFCRGLEDAIVQAQHRMHGGGPVTWEVGSHTRTGRCKEALNRVNEDQVLVKSLTGPDRLLAMVADGISTCDVGSGALASLITTMILENELEGDIHENDFREHMEPVCRRAAQVLLDWALERGYLEQLVQGLDLMGTTLTAAWIEGRHVHLANLGDSRAYLLNRQGAEQLTVDGDLGSGLLAEGTPPETVQGMGGLAKALRRCIGGCLVDSEGKPVILEDSCRPTLGSWPLLPGDVLILCSDGLIEEGMFLEPDQVLDLVEANAHRSVEELAELLVDAADDHAGSGSAVH